MEIFPKYQDITVLRTDQDGKTISRSKVNFAPIYELLESSKVFQDKYPFLSSIDPYDDTCFNSKQKSILLEELRQLRKLYSPQTMKKDLSRLIDFVRRPVKIHRFIRFAGD